MDAAGPPSQEQHSLAEALVALASREGLRDPVDWEDVRAAILALEQDHMGATDLRHIIDKLNDRDVAHTLEDWILRVAEEREVDSEDASRAAEKLLAPLQRVGLGGLATGAIAAAAGTISPAAAAVIIVAMAAGAAATTYGLWRLSKRQDAAKHDSRALHRLAEIAGAGRG